MWGRKRVFNYCLRIGDSFTEKGTWIASWRTRMFFIKEVSKCGQEIQSRDWHFQRHRRIREHDGLDKTCGSVVGCYFLLQGIFPMSGRQLLCKCSSQKTSKYLRATFLFQFKLKIILSLGGGGVVYLWISSTRQLSYLWYFTFASCLKNLKMYPYTLFHLLLGNTPRQVVIMSNRQSEAHRGEIFYPRSYTELMTEYMYVQRSAKCWETCKI